MALLSLAFLLLVTVAVASTWGCCRTRRFNQDVNHAQAVRELARNVLTDVVDVQTGERGYMATGQPDYLDVYNHALDRLSAEMNALQTRGGFRRRAQLRRVATLKIDIDAKVAELKRSVAYVAANRGARGRGPSCAAARAATR